MIAMTDIQRATQRFFDRHWMNTQCGGNPAPEWSAPWNLVGSMPNTDKQGCYVLLANDTVKYIGSGVGKGSGRYKECGLGARTWNYMKWDKSKKASLAERIYMMIPPYRKMTALATIGFLSGYGYLALALEAFLIAEFRDKGLSNVKSTK
jgi:hypothetical protein